MGPFLGGELGDDHEPGSRAVVLQGQHHKQTRPRPDHHGQAAEVMLSMSPPRPRVDEKLPSSAPETSQRCRGSFVASWPIVAQARGSGDAAGAAHAHRAAAAHPTHRRGEERPRARRHDGVEAPLRHWVRHAAAPPAARCATPSSWAWPDFFFSARARTRTSFSAMMELIADVPTMQLPPEIKRVQFRAAQ